MKQTILVVAVFMSIIFSATAQNLSKSRLCKKWYLSHYEHFWIDYEPETNEANDYIQFKPDMTYESVDEGKKTTGRWSFNAKEKYILMYDGKGNHIKLLVEDLDEKEFVFEIDDKELQGVEIHYSIKKK
jgi:hypothetical protein